MQSWNVVRFFKMEVESETQFHAATGMLIMLNICYSMKKASGAVCHGCYNQASKQFITKKPERADSPKPLETNSKLLMPVVSHP